MGAAPRWKVYSGTGDLRACCKNLEEAAAVVGLLGEGATIRDGHLKRRTVWTEGNDGYAADSYDHVVIIASARGCAQRLEAATRRVQGIW
jgi:hypothetical protein